MLIEDRYRKLTVVYHRIISENKRIKEALATVTAAANSLKKELSETKDKLALSLKTTTTTNEIKKDLLTVTKEEKQNRKYNKKKTKTDQVTTNADIKFNS